jgi:hypothetical protein
VHGDPADIVAADLALAGVQAGPHVDGERPKPHRAHRQLLQLRARPVAPITWTIVN